MNKVSLFLGLGILAATLGIQAQTTIGTTSVQNVSQDDLMQAREGCQKSLGFFPTPAKLKCVLTALGLPADTKPKALALIFNVCHGRILKADTSGIAVKSHPTLASCLSDPQTVDLLNKELQAHGFSPVKVSNPSILEGLPTAPKAMSS